MWEEVGLAKVHRSLQRAGMGRAASLSQPGWCCPERWQCRAPLCPSFVGWLAGCAPATGRARHRMGWDSAPVPRLRLLAQGQLPGPCGAAGCPRRNCSSRWHRAVLQGAGAGSAFCEPQLVLQPQGTSVCSPIPPCIFVAAKSQKLLARWLPMGGVGRLSPSLCQASCEPGRAFCAPPAGKGAGCILQGQEVWSTGAAQGKGGGHKRGEEGALNSINLQKEAAAKRGSYEHGVSDVNVCVLLAWLRTWPCCELWQDSCWAGKRSGSQHCSLVLHSSRVWVWPRQLLQAVSDGQPQGCGVSPLPSGGGSPQGQGMSLARAVVLVEPADWERGVGALC